MAAYIGSTPFPTVTWRAPVEPVWQMLPSGSERLPGYKRQDLGLVDRLFIGAVVNIPRERRPWGSITWLAEVFDTSRPTIYAIGERAREGMEARPGGRPAQPPAATEDRPIAENDPVVRVTRNRIARATLTYLLPGGATGRTIDDCLRVALDEGRSTGFVSELLHKGGEKAGEVLAGIDHSVMGPVVLARDEIFVRREPNLLLVEPYSLTITGLYATAARDAETWACALLFTEDRQVQIIGLAEDDCTSYDASCKVAELDAAIQKDVWHPLNKVGQVVKDIEREALRAMKVEDKLEKQLAGQWDDAVFDEWVTNTERIEHLLEQSTQLRFWRGCLWDALEIVDMRAGDIRDRAINQWLLDEILAGLRQLDHPRIKKLVTSLETLAPELLTFLDSLAQPLADWQVRLGQHFSDGEWAAFFQTSVARLWRLEHAVRIGHNQFQKATIEARQLVAELVTDDPLAHKLAEELLTLLERTVRTSCAAEAINSVLRPYFDRRRESTDQVSRQLFLNLFTLWWNMHKFTRGPRKGKSPYELAGIDPGTDDWLTLLGFPPD